MNLLERLITRCNTVKKTLVLPEGNDPRVMDAAAKIVKKGIAAKVIVLATPAEAKESLAKAGVEFAGLTIEVMDYLANAELAAKLAARLFERRKAKGMTEADAAKTVKNRLYFGNLMLGAGLVDGMVAGSIASTPDMLRASFHCLGTAKGIKIASGCFLMDMAKPTPAGDDVLLYADSGVNINPSAEELADIAISSAMTRQALIGGTQYIALLSFSTKGSAKHELVDKVTQATAIAQQKIAELKLPFFLDGELQADAALVAKVGASKAPGSPVAGKANVLIFPNLECGNICYKLTERLAGAIAYGPILQGVAKPVNDLSRGCVADDIVGVAAITICQAMG
ncbi:MAG: phosphate acetyltransferase [Lentisphaeria bacterium]